MEAAVEKRGRNRGEPAKSRTHLIADTAEEAFSESGNGEEWRELAKWQGARGKNPADWLDECRVERTQAHKRRRQKLPQAKRSALLLYGCAQCGKVKDWY